jgi:surfeit locus 1 family protein
VKRFPLSLRFWIITLCAVFACTVSLSLGLWQLSRAAQKEAIASSLQRQSALPVLSAQALFGEKKQIDADQSLIHRTVELDGRWLADATVYLDNRQMMGRPGFYVMTPFRVDHSGAVVLIQRGWLPRDFMDRTHIVPYTTESGPVVIRGRIALSPTKLFEVGAADNGIIRQNIELAAFAGETGLALQQFMVVQTGPDGGGLARQWPVVSTGVEKHYGYAFQWVALSVLIMVLYVWFQFFRRSGPLNDV